LRIDNSNRQQKNTPPSFFLSCFYHPHNRKRNMDTALSKHRSTSTHESVSGKQLQCKRISPQPQLKAQPRPICQLSKSEILDKVMQLQIQRAELCGCIDNLYAVLASALAETHISLTSA
jgi:hypothetical protein